MKKKNNLALLGQTAVFGIEFLFHEMHFIDVGSCYPSLNLVLNDGSNHILIPFTREVKDGETWKMSRKKQIVFSDDAFQSVKQYKITLNVVTPVDSTPIATISFDLRPFLTDSIACHGFSQVAKQRSLMHDILYKTQTVEIAFEMRTIFFKFCEKKGAVFTSSVDNLPYSEKLTMKRTDSDDESDLQSKGSMLMNSNVSQNRKRSSRLSRAETIQPSKFPQLFFTQ